MISTNETGMIQPNSSDLPPTVNEDLKRRLQGWKTSAINTLLNLPFEELSLPVCLGPVECPVLFDRKRSYQQERRKENRGRCGPKGDEMRENKQNKQTGKEMSLRRFTECLLLADKFVCVFVYTYIYIHIHITRKRDCSTISPKKPDLKYLEFISSLMTFHNFQV